jgi:glycosyltransferase involved in cell wall biosynthesis
MQTTRKIKAFPVYMGQSGCDYHRIRLPFIYGGDYYNDDPYKGFEVSRMLEYINLSEILVYNRLFPLNMERLRKIREQGVKIVCDLDDWYILPDYHPNYKQYRDYASREIVENLKFADLVTVTTDRLYQKVKDLNRNIHVIPNALPFGDGQFVPQPENRTRHDKFNFIYTGQSSHLEDVRIMQAQVKRASKLNVSFSLAGYKPGSKVWQGIENVFNQGGDYERIDAQPLDSYMTVYDNADCSLVPLKISDFNSCKSNLKLLEAAAKKIPCIVSHVAPYKDDSDAPVLWVKTPDDWYKHIKYFSEHPDEAKQMGESLHQWARQKYNLHKWNQVRFELYQSLL